jgi:TolB protein
MAAASGIGKGNRASAAKGSGSGLPAFSADAHFSFVSFQPETFSEGDLVQIQNVTTGQMLSTPMADGGLDPIGIPAEVGDTIEIRVFEGTELIAAFSRETPRKTPPRIVRIHPPDRKIKVPLNSRALVIFSEPIQPGSVTLNSLRLEQNGLPVLGSTGLTHGGLGVEFTPSANLRYNTEYSVIVGPGIADLSGDAFGTTHISSFHTIEFPVPLPGKVAFEDRPTGNGEIYLMAPDGSGVIQVTDSVNGGFAMSPALSPDGSRIAFSVVVLSSVGGVLEDFEIYTVNVDGSDPVNVTNHPGFDGWRPAWSPDGSRIAFFSTRDDPANDEIYTVNADGTDLQRLTFDPADDANPAWSPDGSKIAFVSNRSGNFEIYVMNSDGTEIIPLTDHPGDDDWPSWSPGGDRIAFASDRDGGMNIYVANPDGSGPERLTNTPGLSGTLPTWSPDGAWIAYDCGGICIMRADGSEPKRISTGMFPSWGQ